MENNEFKYALVTLSDTNFLLPTYVFIKSFLEHNKWFEGDIVILISENISTEDTLIFFNLYSKIKFISPDQTKYKEAIRHIIEDFPENGITSGYWPHMLKFETFGLEEYDRTVYYDSDVLVVGNIRDAFFNDYDYIICDDRTERPPFDKMDKRCSEPLFNLNLGVRKFDKKTYLNSGFFSVKNPKKSKVNSLIKIAENYQYDGKFYIGYCIDQDVINIFLRNKNTYLYGFEYNALQMHYKTKYNRHLTTEKSIHYLTGYKPWLGNFKYEFYYIHKFWYDEVKSIKPEIVNKLSNNLEF